MQCEDTEGRGVMRFFPFSPWTFLLRKSRACLALVQARKKRTLQGLYFWTYPLLLQCPWAWEPFPLETLEGVKIKLEPEGRIMRFTSAACPIGTHGWVQWLKEMGSRYLWGANALRENDSAPFSAVSTELFTEFQRVIFLASLWPVLAAWMLIMSKEERTWLDAQL